MTLPSGWSAQKLAEFLAAVSSYATEYSAADGAVERVAESLDAEVVAVVTPGAAVAAIGYPEGAVPVAELVAVARGHRRELTVPGAGSRPAAVVELEHPPGARMVVARSGPPLSPDETGLLHAMARVTSMALRMIRSLDDERALRRESQRKSAENARLLETLTEHQVRLERLAAEQAALRRVATLVARQPGAGHVLGSVMEEVGQLLGAGLTQMLRYEGAAAAVVAGWAGPQLRGPVMPLATRVALEGDALAGFVFREHRATRVNSGSLGTGGALAEHLVACGLRSATAAPIDVEGGLWGVIVAGWPARTPPLDAETRIAEFAQLVATSIANAHARSEVVRLADEQAALRRVATLVAEGEPPAAIFASVAEEITRITHVENGYVVRFEPDDTLTVVATRGELGYPHVGATRPLDGDGVAARVYRTGRPAHVLVPGETLVSSVGAPILLGDRLWGAAIGTSATRSAADLDDADAVHEAGRVAEKRIAELADLVAIAISNADAHAQLTTSRARVVAAADDARRRLERNLHDGIQQGLVSLALALREAESMAPTDPPELPVALSRIVDGLGEVLDELREISRGLHPANLAEGGLEFALRSLARRSAVPATLDVRVTGRLPDRVEVPAYYVVSEALTNAAKHAQASQVDIDVAATDGVVRVSVRDDGVGGADTGKGSGLIGLVDRVEAAGGEITITSPPGGGTALLATFRLADR
ncbi:GAF domain-containing protein [Pseudonocardia zijingensis]|uniref:histidine kinase n=1 Tax=Pseudonocardia zijingensis TaxID=153376 RepID=A0ABN1QTB8_9PSEU